jgi:uncharacterized protein (DUF736 family)
MAIIGHFTKGQNGIFDGTIATMTTCLRVGFMPLEKKGKTAPDYRIVFGSCDLGAAWKHTGANGEYLSVQLDDPSFRAPINCALVKKGAENVYILIWERDRKRA